MKEIKSKIIKEVDLEEFFRIGILIYGTHIDKEESNKIISRYEFLLGEKKRHITVRNNKNSPFYYDNNTISANINNEIIEVPAEFFEKWAGENTYQFNPIRENGPSLVFDWVHDYCANTCNFCFKEYDWVLLKNKEINKQTNTLKERIKQNIQSIEKFLENNTINAQKYPFSWLCTGTLPDPEEEKRQHLQVLESIKKNNYEGKIFMSISPPRNIVYNKQKTIDFCKTFKDAGLERINSGMELVSTEMRKKYMRGFKGTLVCNDYYDFLGWASNVFEKEVGSCVLIGLEPHEKSLEGIEELARRGIQAIPTIYTSFIPKQLENQTYGDIDSYIYTSLRFKEIVEKYKMEKFESVFGLI